MDIDQLCGCTNCEYVSVIFRVWIPAWQLEEETRALRVGDELSSWLTFREAAEVSPPAEAVHVVEGTARPLPDWPGATLGRHPLQIDVAGGALYWDAPEPIEGAVAVAGIVCTNNVDAPDGFPETTGVVRRIRMEWHDFVMGANGSWRSERTASRYEEVPATYFPAAEAEDVDPEVEAELARRAREAYDREVSQGRLRRGDRLTVALPAHRPAPPPGTNEARWTGVLIDLDIGGPGNGVIIKP